MIVLCVPPEVPLFDGVVVVVVVDDGEVDAVLDAEEDSLVSS